MANTFHKLKVSGIKPETADCSSVSFEIPAALKENFQYTQGQYLTLRFQLNGKEERRAYSMSSSPLDANITVTVKRLKDGLVSNHINSNIKVGDEIEVMAPQGKFYTKLGEEQKKSYYLFAAGSGITPLMSILKTILEKEPMSTVFLLYGNRTQDSIIFKAELDALENRYDNQLIIEHILSGGSRKPGGIIGWFKKKSNIGDGKKGRINKESIKRFLSENPPRNEKQEYFICGPAAMMDMARGVLENKDISKKNIHVEYFTDPGSVGKPGASGAPAGSSKLKVKLDGQYFELEAPQNKAILDTLLDHKKEPPYSCTSGSCSTCIAKVLKGSAKMEVCFALDDDEIEEGFILTCQALPTSPEIEIDYDV